MELEKAQTIVPAHLYPYPSAHEGPYAATWKCLLLIDKYIFLFIFRNEMNQSTCISLSTLLIP